MECAVGGDPDEKWGERPKAFVTSKPESARDEAEIIDFCKRHIAGFKAPAAVDFGELPKTSTGKIQKFVLRDGSGRADEADQTSPMRVGVLDQSPVRQRGHSRRRHSTRPSSWRGPRTGGAITATGWPSITRPPASRGEPRGADHPGGRG